MWGLHSTTDVTKAPVIKEINKKTWFSAVNNKRWRQKRRSFAGMRRGGWGVGGGGGVRMEGMRSVLTSFGMGEETVELVSLYLYLFI